MTLLETIRDRGMALEINTSGFVNRGHPYPADWIIREALRLGIPLEAGSDAHSPEYVGCRSAETPQHPLPVRFKFVSGPLFGRSLAVLGPFLVRSFSDHPPLRGGKQ